MSTVHFLNVGKGDCTLIEHNSGRNTLIDICKGNYTPLDKQASIDVSVEEITDRLREALAGIKGNFGMSRKPTNAVSYIKSVGIGKIHRFILTHPDMDHMDGLDLLADELDIANFWDSGVRRKKPDFGTNREYREEDWDRYESIRDEAEGTKVLRHLAGDRFVFANRNTDGTGGADGLHILAPNAALVALATEDGDVNDGSYVILYRSTGGKILIPGDAHDETWDYILEYHKEDVANCSILFAPHHGRASGRKFDFLDIVKPKMTFFGCARSGHLAYSEWRNRDLRVVTNNQAGNIVLECGDGKIDIYVENRNFAEATGCNPDFANIQGYPFFDSIS